MNNKNNKKWKLYMPVVVEQPYFSIAMESIKKYWDNVIIVNTSRNRTFNYPVEVINLQYMLPFSTVQNIIQEDAIKRELDLFFWMNDDAEMVDDVIDKILSDDSDWDIHFTNYDALSATKIRVAKNFTWDTQFPCYYSDCDFYRRVLLAGYKFKDLFIPNNHWRPYYMNGVRHYGSQSLKHLNPREAWLSKTRGKDSKNKYVAKWGGTVGSEKNSEPYLYTMRWSNLITGLQELIDKELDSDMDMVEIGVWSGQATEMFAQKVKHITGIDPWIPIKGLNEILAEKSFDNKLSKATNISKIKAFDNEVVNQFKDRSLDFVYIDAGHTDEELTRQIKDWIPKIKKGGKIGGHDYADKIMFNHYFPDIKKVVDRNFSNVRFYSDTSWICEV